MLVLSRKVGESIILETSDGSICITVTEVRGKKARVGIVAPKCVHVLRTELIASKPPPDATGPKDVCEAPA